MTEIFYDNQLQVRIYETSENLQHLSFDRSYYLKLLEFTEIFVLENCSFLNIVPNKSFSHITSRGMRGGPRDILRVPRDSVLRGPRSWKGSQGS